MSKSLWLITPDMIRQSIQLLHPDSELFEIRVINGKFNASGYFTDPLAAVNALLNFRPEYSSQYSAASSSNIFITLNPIDQACYSRKQRDKLLQGASPTTQDKEITALHWLLIDLDPKRITGVSSSDTELAYAEEKAKDILSFLSARGWNEPIQAMSGNGYHLVYRFNVPNTPDNVDVFKNALAGLSKKFSDDTVELDTTVFNPARICKLWGTVAQKGDNTPERPHRRACVITHPAAAVLTNNFNLLTSLSNDLNTAEHPQTASKTVSVIHSQKEQKDFDLPGFISQYGIPVKSVERASGGGTKYILEHCLFDSNHTGKDAAIFQQADGTLGYKCFHNSCSDKHWKDVRLLYEPHAYDKKPAEGKKRKDSGTYNIDRTGLLTIENLTEYLRLKGFCVQYDVIKHNLVYSGFKGEAAEYLVETAPTIIFNELQTKLDKCSPSRIAEMLLTIATRNKINPVLDIIRNAKWDGKDRISEIYSLFKIPEDDRLSRVIIEKWLMQAVCGLLNDPLHPFSLDLVLVFKGRQGIGKTRFFEHLALDQRYFGEGVCIDPRNKDSIIQATSNWICELGELGSTMKKDMDSVKAMLTMANDVYRLPYGRASLTFPRLTSFVGTVNDDKFLIDQTGNRRFATISVPDDVRIDYNSQIKPFNAVQLWAQVYYLIKKSVAAGAAVASCFRLPADISALLDSRNEEYTKPMKAEDEVVDILATLEDEKIHPRGNYIVTDKYMTVTEFMNDNPILNKYSADQVGRVLSKIGIASARTGKNRIRTRLLPYKHYN